MQRAPGGGRGWAKPCRAKPPRCLPDFPSSKRHPRATPPSPAACPRWQRPLPRPSRGSSRRAPGGWGGSTRSAPPPRRTPLARSLYQHSEMECCPEPARALIGQPALPVARGGGGGEKKTRRRGASSSARGREGGFLLLFFKVVRLPEGRLLYLWGGESRPFAARFSGHLRWVSRRAEAAGNARLAPTLETGPEPQLFSRRA